MQPKTEEHARLSSRILDLKRRIAEGQENVPSSGLPWDKSGRSQILELLKTTLADFEARLAAARDRSDQECSEK